MRAVTYLLALMLLSSLSYGAVSGKAKFESSCVACHGKAGEIPAMGVSQVIANIGSASKVASLLKRMKSKGMDSGKHGVMVDIAKSLSHQEIQNLSHYIASLKR